MRNYTSKYVHHPHYCVARRECIAARKMGNKPPFEWYCESCDKEVPDREVLLR